MIHVNFRQQLERLLHTHDSPERTSLAFAIGVFFGFSPFIGFHTILVLLVAFVFRLNRVAALIGAYINSPWTLVPVAIASTAIGNRVLRHAGFYYEKFNWYNLGSFHFWISLPHQIRTHYHTLLPFFVGAMICASVLSIISYPLCLWFIRTYRHKLARHHS